MQVRKLRDADAFDAHLAAIGVTFPRHADPAAVLGRPCEVVGRTLANRWVVLPMEGWDGTTDGRPTDLVRRRWRRFGQSGAALVWGGEAVAVRSDGRANPHQLSIGPESVGDLATLRAELLAGHAEATGGGPAAHRPPADALGPLVVSRWPPRTADRVPPSAPRRGGRRDGWPRGHGRVAR